MTENDAPDQGKHADDDGGEGRRVCGYRRCRAVLPAVAGRGNRARFCQDGKTWGARNLTCRDAEAAHVDIESLREGGTPVEDTAVADLAAHLDRTLGPVRALLDGLTGMRENLDATVTAALAARDTAEADATEQRRQRGLADARATDAQDSAAEADRATRAALAAQKAAEHARDAEHQARTDADQARQRAEGRAAALTEELARTTARADAAIAHAADLDTAYAIATADLSALRATYADERTRSINATTRADTAETRAAELAEQVTALRDRADALQAQHQHQLAHTRAETDTVRADLQQRLDATRDRHDKTLNDLHATITDLTRELTTAHRTTRDVELRLTHLTQALHDHAAQIPPPLRELLDGTV